jgi:hypothetical protein
MMAQSVNLHVAAAAKFSGTHLGSIAPSRETSWTGWAVYASGSDIIACVTAPDGMVLGGEKITADELPRYVYDAAKALATLAIANAQRTAQDAAGQEGGAA